MRRFFVAARHKYNHLVAYETTFYQNNTTKRL
uniref:Uncharacterized protein n=1 Tax=Myoviridae sp. ctRci5 TaxID=2825105 RepID=A0A8S5V6L5_9CAUD|nr:MAG TPA: hypothetical protein [Myoviridae sp. ctRci5]